MVKFLSQYMHYEGLEFNATFNKISAISWLSVLLVQEYGVPRENLRPTARHIMLYWVHLAWAGFELATLVVIGTDCIGSFKYNYHTITIMTRTAPMFYEILFYILYIHVFLTSFCVYCL
jgi:hypothetical protein